MSLEARTLRGQARVLRSGKIALWGAGLKGAKTAMRTKQTLGFRTFLAQ